MKRWACLLLGVVACRAEPIEVVQRMLDGVERGEMSVLERSISNNYADPRGDRALALAEVGGWFEQYPSRHFSADGLRSRGLETERLQEVVAEIDLQLGGDVAWRVRGPASWMLEGQADFRLVQGMFEATRDAMELAAKRRAALEANDVELLRPLLHPAYRDGDLDADEALQRLAKDVSGRRIRLRPKNYRLELRGVEAHLDEHYELEIDGRVLPPSVARLTLERSAGRYRIRAGLYPQKAQGSLDAGKSLK